jgi:hypothetical protein
LQPLLACFSPLLCCWCFPSTNVGGFRRCSRSPFM